MGLFERLFGARVVPDPAVPEDTVVVLPQQSKQSQQNQQSKPDWTRLRPIYPEFLQQPPPLGYQKQRPVSGLDLAELGVSSSQHARDLMSQWSRHELEQMLAEVFGEEGAEATDEEATSATSVRPYADMSASALTEEIQDLKKVLAEFQREVEIRYLEEHHPEAFEWWMEDPENRILPNPEEVGFDDDFRPWDPDSEDT